MCGNGCQVDFHFLHCNKKKKKACYHITEVLNCISARFGKEILLTFCSFKGIMFECTAVIISLFPAKGRPFILISFCYIPG